MRIYENRPTARAARKAWDHYTKRFWKEPKKLWFNPNCWQKMPGVVGNAWGWWGAEFPDGRTEMELPGNIKDGIL